MAVPPIPNTMDATVAFIIAASPNGNEKKPVKYNKTNAGNALELKASAATCNDERWDKYLDTIF